VNLSTVLGRKSADKLTTSKRKQMRTSPQSSTETGIKKPAVQCFLGGESPEVETKYNSSVEAQHTQGEGKQKPAQGGCNEDPAQGACNKEPTQCAGKQEPPQGAGKEDHNSSVEMSFASKIFFRF